MMKSTGTYAMAEWNEVAARELPPPQKCTRVDAHGTMDGGMKGEAQTIYMLAYVRADEGVFSGYTYFKGQVGERAGSFVLADEGAFDAKTATTKWAIVKGSGTGELAGISGAGGFSATHGLTVEFTLEYEFER